MPVFTDYGLGRGDDGTLYVDMSDPTPVGGWTVLYGESRRPGGSGPVFKQSSSGLDGVSGITVADSGQGRWAVALRSVDTSGRDFGAWYWKFERTDSGSRTTIAEGYRLANP